MTKREKELYKKYDDLIAFIETTKLNVKAVLNFIILNYYNIEVSQNAFEENDLLIMKKLCNEIQNALEEK